MGRTIPRVSAQANGTRMRFDLSLETWEEDIDYERVATSSS